MELLTEKELGPLQQRINAVNNLTYNSDGFEKDELFKEQMYQKICFNAMAKIVFNLLIPEQTFVPYNLIPNNNIHYIELMNDDYDTSPIYVERPILAVFVEIDSSDGSDDIPNKFTQWAQKVITSINATEDKQKLIKFAICDILLDISRIIPGYDTIDYTNIVSIDDIDFEVKCEKNEIIIKYKRLQFTLIKLYEDVVIKPNQLQNITLNNPSDVNMPLKAYNTISYEYYKKYITGAIAYLESITTDESAAESAVNKSIIAILKEKYDKILICIEKTKNNRLSIPRIKICDIEETYDNFFKEYHLYNEYLLSMFLFGYHFDDKKNTPTINNRISGVISTMTNKLPNQGITTVYFICNIPFYTRSIVNSLSDITCTHTRSVQSNSFSFGTFICATTCPINNDDLKFDSSLINPYTIVFTIIISGDSKNKALFKLVKYNNVNYIIFSPVCVFDIVCCNESNCSNIPSNNFNISIMEIKIKLNMEATLNNDTNILVLPCFRSAVTNQYIDIHVTEEFIFKFNMIPFMSIPMSFNFGIGKYLLQVNKCLYYSNKAAYHYFPLLTDSQESQESQKLQYVVYPNYVEFYNMFNLESVHFNSSKPPYNYIQYNYDRIRPKIATGRNNNGSFFIIIIILMIIMIIIYLFRSVESFFVEQKNKINFISNL